MLHSLWHSKTPSAPVGRCKLLKDIIIINSLDPARSGRIWRELTSLSSIINQTSNTFNGHRSRLRHTMVAFSMHHYLLFVLAVPSIIPPEAQSNYVSSHRRHITLASSFPAATIQYAHPNIQYVRNREYRRRFRDIARGSFKIQMQNSRVILRHRRCLQISSLGNFSFPLPLLSYVERVSAKYPHPAFGVGAYEGLLRSLPSADEALPRAERLRTHRLLESPLDPQLSLLILRSMEC